MTLNLWRFLVIWSLAVWQGGFFFYAAVVVPLAERVIPRMTQGFITRHVSVWINVAGGIALVLFAIDACLVRDPHAVRRRIKWATWLGMAVALVVLLILHSRMTVLMDPDREAVGQGFRPMHKTYLWICTAQWAFSLVHSWTLLAGWRRADPPDESPGIASPS